jgi:hypothetical protein
MPRAFRRVFTVALIICSSARFADAHGFVGDRFFPPTITTDDPFAVDELALPSITLFNTPASDGQPESRTFNAGFEFDKEILPHFAIGVSDDYSTQNGHGGPSAYGWGNVELTAKYQLWQSDIHETIVSIGLTTDIAHSGNVETSDSFSTLEPTLYLGKGFGDLPDSLSALKPLAITATLGQSFPTSAEASNTFDYGFAIEYSLPYLQSQVRNIGLPHPFRDMIPITEFSFSTTENRDGRGITTGTINPGILWENQYIQLGAEALIPINHNSAAHVGVVLQMWIYIDDIFPKLFGHPLFQGANHE